MTEEFDAAVIGGGPGGLTAALVLARARRKIVVFDDQTYRNAQVADFHGFPGRDGTDPAAFRETVRSELARYDVRIVNAGVTNVTESDEGLLVAHDGATAATRRVLMASGVRDELPGIQGLQERWGRSAFNCPFCDGWEYRDRPVVVIDAAPGAEGLAATLEHWTSRVTLAPAGDVEAVLGEGTTVEAVRLTDGRVLEADALFVKAPVRPRSGLATGLGCDVDGDGFIVTDVEGASSNPLVWAAGDVRRAPPLPHQAVVAAAEGSVAATSIHRSLTG